MEHHRSCIKCDKFEDPTDEEIAAEEAEWEKVIERLTISGPFIQEMKQKHPEGGQGVDPCPVCQNNLHWSIASCNGHMHGRCETGGCLNWME
jgi:hypothetical protein